MASTSCSAEKNLASSLAKGTTLAAYHGGFVLAYLRKTNEAIIGEHLLRQMLLSCATAVHFRLGTGRLGEDGVERPLSRMKCSGK
ncbi:unnamed protein product [Sphagnum jensenii]